VLKVAGLSYVVDDQFKGGTYEMLIRDVTQGITADKKMQDIRIELVIIDPEELAA